MKVDEIHIQWPTGLTESLTDVPANLLLEITETQVGQSASAEGFIGGTIRVACTGTRRKITADKRKKEGK